MEQAVTWGAIILVALIVSAYILAIRPAVVSYKLEREARDLATTLATEITFVARAYESGVLSQVAVVEAPESPNKYYEMHVDENRSVVEVWVVAETLTGEIRVKAEAPFYSPINVTSPPKLYSGKIFIVLAYDEGTGSYLIKVANIVAQLPEAGG
ncbi:MAG: hypothetical protein DRG33_07540 [Deltaproteobacteria bacterium]|nr:MAG: hypothetical protein DRG33_07540 [Deltaproteobacteria bacterium]